jgi:fucose 4-O-acetylase-like acetyltransferase
MQAETSRDTVDWVLTAKGIGIILVVIGHFHPEASPAYWTGIKNIMYAFHMPLFFILSGYLYTHGKYSYSTLLKAKARRLLYPFITIAALVFVIKYAAGMVVTLDHPVTLAAIIALMRDPVESYMPLLWFMHALFIIFTLYVPARRFLNNIFIVLIVLAFNIVFGNDYPVIGKALDNMPFFVFGVMLRENLKVAGIAMGSGWRACIVPLALFAAAYIMLPFASGFEAFDYPARLFLGAAGSLFVMNASRAITEQAHKKITGLVMQVGYYSMTIYLLHTIFESAVRIGFVQVLNNAPVLFECVACIAIACGVAFPLLLEKEVLRKNRFTRKFILGLS